MNDLYEAINLGRYLVSVVFHWETVADEAIAKSRVKAYVST